MNSATIFLLFQFVCQLVGTALVCWAWWVTPRGQAWRRPAFVYLTSWFALISVAVLVRRGLAFADAAFGMGVPMAGESIATLFIAIATMFVGSRLVRVAHGLDPHERPTKHLVIAGAATVLSMLSAPSVPDIDWSDNWTGGVMP